MYDEKCIVKNLFPAKSRACQQPEPVGFSLLSLLGNPPRYYMLFIKTPFLIFCVTSQLFGCTYMTYTRLGQDYKQLFF